MTTFDQTNTFIIPREITFTDISLPSKRAVSILFEDGTERAVTFSFTHLDYSDVYIVEVYWWDSTTKIIGFYGIIEELYPIEVKNPDTGITEFIVLPRLLVAETVVDNRMKTVKMSPRLWIYEIDDL